jgi:phosphoglycolate phosphatase
MAAFGPLIAFDLDGTLHWTEKALVPAIQEAMRDMGLEPAEARRINALYGEPLEEFCRRLLGLERGDGCDRFREGIRRHQRKTLPRQGSLYPGVREALLHLSSLGATLVVISNAGSDYIELVLRTFGIRHLFSRLLGADSGASKAKRLESLRTSTDWPSTVMVGDRYHDMEAAKSAGVFFIGCSYGYGSAQELAGADEIIERATGLLPALAGLGIIFESDLPSAFEGGYTETGMAQVRSKGGEG